MFALAFPNRLGIAPMEGADSLPDGSSSEFTTTRYVNEAKGGSAVIWLEAVSIVPEGRPGHTQLLLSRENLEAYKVFWRNFPGPMKDRACMAEAWRIARAF